MAALQFLGGTVAVGAGLLAVLSITSVQPTEIALSYNWLLSTVSSEVIATPGLKFIGPFNRLIRYPKTIQTLEYDEAQRDLLDGRTRDCLSWSVTDLFSASLFNWWLRPFFHTLQDGLPLILGLSFQYRLMADRLPDLYFTYENEIGDYEKIYKLVGP
eukprot:g33217.t1